MFDDLATAASCIMCMLIIAPCDSPLTVKHGIKSATGVDYDTLVLDPVLLSVVVVKP